MIATESSELSKLSGNIDSYPNWDNDIHKRLKMKYYTDDVDQRLENLKKTDVANLDFNNRYFPPLYIDTPTPESMAKEAILQKIMSLRDNNLVPTSDGNNRSDPSAMAEVNKDKMDEAITEYKEKVNLDNLDQVEEPAQESAYVAPIGKSSKQITGSKNPARAQLIPAAMFRKKMNPKTYEGLNENETNESVLMLMNDDKLREKARNSRMSAQGIKIPKSKSALINRFNLLKGQICSGNDNPTVVTEIKAISKELYNKGMLDKHL